MYFEYLENSVPILNMFSHGLNDQIEQYRIHLALTIQVITMKHCQMQEKLRTSVNFIIYRFIFTAWFVLSFYFLLPPGVRIGLFTPDRAFDMVSKAQIAKLKEPSLKLVDLVTHEMMNMCKDATGKVRFGVVCEHKNRNR